MTEEEKRNYFCHIHTNLFSQSKCHHCYRGMCHTCLHNNSTICPDCIRTQFLTGDQYKNQKEISYILSIGLGVTLLFHVYQYYTISEIYNNFNFLESLLYVLLGTLTAISAYYMYSEVTIIRDVSKIPFIGGKLVLLLILISLVIGIPLLYLLYKIAVFLRHHLFS
ncbi:hypothetical protein [uncultured Aquimarina sp.]|uniref:hypothetical protein n=1 Tax=uncultured Aquimarina sp. TaxID=575652 RepID=UPI00262DA7AB|nr:hypothetical protein [uncultured Aquimarina sp.]